MIVLEELIPTNYVIVLGNEPLRRYRLQMMEFLHRNLGHQRVESEEGLPE
jgi:hypothetical protein